MKYLAIIFSLLLFSCSNKKSDSPLSVEEYRAIASKADQEALRLWKIQQKYEEEQLDIDSIYFMCGEVPIYKDKHDSLQILMDSLEVLILVQDSIMNKAHAECEKYHHTWAL